MVLIVQASLRIITNDHHNNMIIVQAIGPQASNKLKILLLIQQLTYNFYYNIGGTRKMSF